MLPTPVTKNVIAPRRQARKERFLLINNSPNLGGLCAFARVTVFPIAPIRHSAENFKYLWLDFRLRRELSRTIESKIRNPKSKIVSGSLTAKGLSPESPQLGPQSSLLSPQLKEPSGIAFENGLFLRWRAIQRVNLIDRLPIPKRVRVVGSDEEMICPGDAH